MTTTERELEEAAARRSAEVTQRSHRPSERRCAPDRGSLPVTRGALMLREVLTDPDGMGPAVRDDGSVPVGGLASVTEHPYEMYDMFGPYNEIVSHGAFEGTLSASPLVEFTANHGAGGGLPMAHTRNGTLELAEDDNGLAYTAHVDPGRSDVSDMLKAVGRGDLAEASFRFRILSGQWSPDYSEYRINSVDLHRGDVSTVNFGANPAATTALRAARAATAIASDPEALSWLEPVGRRSLRRDLMRLAGRIQARAMAPGDTQCLSELLAVLAAADAAFDPLANAVGQASDGIDQGMLTLAMFLGVPNPDYDAPDGDDEGAATDPQQLPTASEPRSASTPVLSPALAARFAAAAAGAVRSTR